MYELKLAKYNRDDLFAIWHDVYKDVLRLAKNEEFWEWALDTLVNNAWKNFCENQYPLEYFALN